MATPISPNAKSSSLFFFDARTCKEWLKAIPLTSVVQSQQKILDALRMLNADVNFQPVERLTSMELMREKVSFLLSAQRIRYVGKSLPLSSGDLAAWNVSITLLTEMESGYRRCYQDAQGDGRELSVHASLIIQRVIRYIGLGMLMAGFIYRRFDNSIWMRLHLQWIEAETRDLTSVRVKDSVGTADGYSSISQAYIAVLLGQLANIYELGPREIDFTDAVLKRFTHKVSIVRPGETKLPADTFLAVDLLADEGASFCSSQTSGEHLRVLEVYELSRSLRRRIKKLAAGEDPATMDLPTGWGTPEAMQQLSRLHNRWCEPSSSRPVASIPTEHNAIVAFGIPEIHFFLSGDFFEQPDVKRELSRQEISDIAMFGRVSEATIRARYAEFNYGSETWAVIDESRSQLRLIRPTNSSRSLAIGRLVGVRVTSTTDSSKNSNDFYLCVVRGLVEETPNQFTVTLTMLPGKPEATSVRSSDNKSRSATYIQGFRLPPMDALGIPETLVIPANLVPRGRGVDIFHPEHGSAKQVNIVDFIDRGVDFDRVTIAG